MSDTPPIRLLLHSLQSPINLGSILRVAETYAIPVDILDAFGVLGKEDARRTVSDFSIGAYIRGAHRLVEAPDTSHGRMIATCLEGTDASLESFHFLPGDTIAVGNEYDGLPQNFIDAADVRLRIPMPDTFTPKLPSHDPIDPDHPEADPTDGRPVLSAAMSAGIVCYASYLQLLTEAREGG